MHMRRQELRQLLDKLAKLDEKYHAQGWLDADEYYEYLALLKDVRCEVM